MWERSVAVLTEALERSGLPYEAVAGEAAFYGPKIDVQIADPAGRESTLSTVQADFHQPARFGLRYVAPDGSRRRPVMIHRSVLGSLERVVAHLVEVHGGAFPAWLAPVQVRVLPVSASQEALAGEFVRRAVAAGLRAEQVPADRGGLGARVRAARLAPYVAVLGKQEARTGGVALRPRGGGRPVPMDAEEALRTMCEHSRPGARQERGPGDAGV